VLKPSVIFAPLRNSKMIAFTDSHTHLYLPEFDQDREKVVERAIQAGVNRLCLPNIDSRSVEPMLDLCKRFPPNCYPMIGLHPTSVKADFETELEKILIRAKERSYIAVGEIGIDLYWDKTFFEQQKHAFSQQIELALDLKWPVVIHSRNALTEILEVLKQFPVLPRGVFHCFPGNINQAAEIIGMGFYIGIGGVVSYKNSGMQPVVKSTDLCHILLETDAPYLSPVPFRGQRNEPAYLLNTARVIAEIKNCSVEEVAEKTTAAATEIFKI
jgi:TatD DNase family protein